MIQKFKNKFITFFEENCMFFKSPLSCYFNCYSFHNNHVLKTNNFGDTFLIQFVVIFLLAGDLTASLCANHQILEITILFCLCTINEILLNTKWVFFCIILVYCSIYLTSIFIVLLIELINANWNIYRLVS